MALMSEKPKCASCLKFLGQFTFEKQCNLSEPQFSHTVSEVSNITFGHLLQELNKLMHVKTMNYSWPMVSAQ